ncbi:MAG: hypothetical protein JSV88_13895 [Candidatus Aminicenantes bacterium]|nr:MAG: hypothetical protein JSV88_13895 [Candidatus Aminicenantes bacterium]
MGLFSPYWQHHHDYKILREDNHTFKGVKTIVVESIPRFPHGENSLFGKAWIRTDDYSILKIEWNPKSLGNAEDIKKAAKKLQSTPQVTFTTEYLIERQGIRYPSRSFLEESYVNKEGEKRTLITTVIDYKDYHFFVVGTEVKRVKMGKF